jgi:hypothetical protein
LRLADAENKKVRAGVTIVRSDGSGNELSSNFEMDVGAITELKKSIKELRTLNSAGVADMSSLWLTPDPMQNITVHSPMYDSLQGDEFRLVQLRAGEASMPIEISLVVDDLSRLPSYAAPSYVVGQKNEIVSVNFRPE